MLRSRVVLIVVVLSSVALLYSLPRVVVENDGDALEARSQSGSESAPDMPSAPMATDQHHAMAELPDSLLETANNLRNTLISLEDRKKRLIFADSLAGLYRGVGQYDSAAAYLEVKLQVQPSREHLLEAGDLSYEAMGFAMASDRRSAWAEKARAYYEKVLEEEPELPDVRVKVGMTYLSGNNPMAGITMIRQVAEEYPDNVFALYQLGVLSVTTGQYDKAIERLTRLMRLDPSNGEGRFYLGYSYYETGRYEEAEKSFREVLNMEVSPELRETASKYLEQIDNI